jgi:hypothetical protein
MLNFGKNAASGQEKTFYPIEAGLQGQKAK